MVGGRGVKLAAESGVRDEPLYVAVEVAGARPGVHAEDLVRSASAVDRDWLPEHLVKTVREIFYDRDRDRVLGRRRTRFEDLVIDEIEVPVEDGAEAARVLARAVADDPGLLDRALPTDPGADRDLRSFLERVRFLAHHAPELDLPELSREHLASLVPVLASGGARSLTELSRAPWLGTLRGSLSYPQLQALDEHAPERLEVPSGSHVRLTYRGSEPPILPVRIQEMFGATDTPRVARGRVPVLLHLLAPNMRPQQVTDDLAGFWRRTYAQVKKDLAGRYPKHAWPDDPVAAPPQRRPGRRRNS
jgi:ATP-dependent helicase HrpB